jgi:hypothetical protein
MRTATKTVIKLLTGAHSKRGGFFVMKRATSRVIGTSLFKRNALINHVININAINEFLNKTLWNHKVGLLLMGF